MPKVINKDNVVINSSGYSEASVDRLESFASSVPGARMMTGLCGTQGTPFKRKKSIKVRGTGAATRGTKARGPMG